MVGVCSVKGGGLPAEGGELARAGDRDDARGLAPLAVKVLPALVQASLGAPGDLDDAWVLAGLAAGECLAAARRVAVVVGGLDEQPAGVGRPSFGNRALAALLVSEVRSVGTTPKKPDSRLGLGNRPKSPTSAHSPAPESVSMPRKQRSLAIAAAWPDSGTCSPSATISVARRPMSSSTAAR